MLQKIMLAVLCLFTTGLVLADQKAETKNVTGEVKSLSADSMVVTVDHKDWTFIVDKDTNVVAEGASHTTRKAEGAKETTMITDFIKVKQTVVVDYMEKGGKFTAKEIRVK
jgi:hypothetical protein